MKHFFTFFFVTFSFIFGFSQTLNLAEKLDYQSIKEHPVFRMKDGLDEYEYIQFDFVSLQHHATIFYCNFFEARTHLSPGGLKTISLHDLKVDIIASTFPIII